jgi:hypothetical protein
MKAQCTLRCLMLLKMLSCDGAQQALPSYDLGML